MSLSRAAPLIGGTEISTEEISLPVEIMVCDGMAYVGVNITDTKGLVTNENKRKEFEKQFSDLKTSMKDSSKYLNKNLKDLRRNIKGQSFKQRMDISGIKPEFDVIGYGKCEWDESGLQSIDFELVFVFEMEYEFKYQTVVWVIPVTLEIGAELGAQLSGGVTYNFTNGKFVGNLDLTLSFALEPFAGIGISGAVAAGVSGKAQLDIGICLLSNEKPRGVEDISLTGGLGIKAYFGPWEHETIFAEGTWHIYSRPDSNSVQLLNTNEYSADAMYDVGNYSISTQVYKSDLMNSASNGVLISDVYLSAAPQIATSDTATVMTFLTSDLERGTANQVQLLYSVYNSVDGSWSEPAPVDGNETNDWTHRLCVVDGDIWVLYQDSDAVLAEDADADALADSFTMKAMKFDPETGTFVDPVCVSGTNGYNSLPAIGTANSAPVAAWVNNTDTDFFGLNSTNSIRYSSYSDGAWSDGVQIASGLNCVTDLAIGELDGKLCIAYITDGDNDLTTSEDRTLYLYTDGNTATISEGNVTAVLADFLMTD